MTSLLCWIGVDQRRPASLHMASDSRLTFSDGVYRDDCAKLFASSVKPDVAGIVGSGYGITLATAVLRDLAVSDLVGVPRLKFAKELCAHFLNGQILAKGSRLFVATRINPDPKRKTASEFYVATISLDIREPTFELLTKQPESSNVVLVVGSGKKDIKDELTRWARSYSGGTSRALFSAFCDGIGATDSFSGGAPQLVGLRTFGSGKHFGVSWEDRVFVSGSPSEESQECFNHLFERCDPVTGLRLSDVQIHAPFRK